MALWNKLVQEKLDQGYSTLNAYDAVNAENPGLWPKAAGESALRARQR
jgi:hypothetical protein